MPEQLNNLMDASTADAPPQNICASNRLRWFELVLLLSIAVGPYILSSIHLLITGQPSRTLSPNFQWASSLFHEVTALLLLGYILLRRTVRFAGLGLRWSLSDLTSGVGLLIGSYCAYYAGYVVVHTVHYAIFGAAQSGMTAQTAFGHMGISAVPFVLLNPFFEELIVRAFLMTEIKGLTGSAALSVALSVTVQTLYHLYYGWEGALSLGFSFLVFALYYSKTGKVTPIIMAHGAFDLFSLFRLW